MLYYGYRFDRNDVPKDVLPCIEDHEMTLSCYSVSAYVPTECGFGVVIGDFSTMFNSVRLNDITAAANKIKCDVANDVQAKFKALPASIRKVMKGPDFFLLEDTDD